MPLIFMKGGRPECKFNLISQTCLERQSFPDILQRDPQFNGVIPYPTAQLYLFLSFSLVLLSLLLPLLFFTSGL